MEAPTPVSSLVHRRTLVTGGYFLLVFFNNERFGFFVFFLLFFSLISIFISSFLSILELDIKQLVAWSTMSQVSLVFLFFGRGYYFFSFLHLLSHAFFKSLLFLQVGFLIVFNSGDQDYRKLKGFFNYNYVVISFFVSVFSLISLFFLGGIISKDIFLDFFFEGNSLFLLGFFILILLLLTFFYSFKIAGFLMSFFFFLKLGFSFRFFFCGFFFFFVKKLFFVFFGGGFFYQGFLFCFCFFWLVFFYFFCFVLFFFKFFWGFIQF